MADHYYNHVNPLDPKPPVSELCKLAPCYNDYKWMPRGMTPCSRSCLGGTQVIIRMRFFFFILSSSLAFLYPKKLKISYLSYTLSLFRDFPAVCVKCSHVTILCVVYTHSQLIVLIVMLYLSWGHWEDPGGLVVGMGWGRVRGKLRGKKHQD